MSEAMTHLDDSICADLVLGLLPRASADAALAHAERCAECEARLRAHAGASVRAHVEAGSDGDAAREAAVIPLPPRSAPRPAWIATIAAGAAAALFLALAIPRLGREAPALSAPERLTSAREIVRTRADAALDPRLVEGLAAYERGEPNEAVQALRAASAAGAAEQVRRLYLGHALLSNAQPIEALAWLESVDLAQLPEPWHGEAVRSLAAAWRANGRHAQADSLARAIAP